MKNIDLHVHSTASDGTFSPSELIDMAERLDLAAIALTDHDTVSGLPEFLKRAETSDVKAVPGVEVAVDWNYREPHILGLFISHDCPELNKLLKEIRDNRHKRNDKIVEKLQANGYDITIDEVKEIGKGESIGRPHVAATLVKKGYFKTVKDVFGSCLARGGTCYVARILPDPKTAILAIHEAGGLAFWAHPVHRKNSNTKDVFSNLKYLKSLGLDGVEVYYSQFSQAQHEMLMKYAKDLDLAVCGGSDFHGANQPDVAMGKGLGTLSIPESVYDDLRVGFGMED